MIHGSLFLWPSVKTQEEHKNALTGKKVHFCNVVKLCLHDFCKWSKILGMEKSKVVSDHTRS